MSQGTTLPEVLLVLTVLGVLVGIAGPPLSRLGDRAAVVAARESLIGRIVEARALASELGGATLLILPDPPTVLLVAVGDTLRSSVLGAGVEGVRVRPARTTELTFDGMGLGRFASATVRLERGSASTSVVVSAYGRVRRR